MIENRMSFSELEATSKQSDTASESDYRDKLHAMRRGLRIPKHNISSEASENYKRVEPINPLEIKRKSDFIHPFAQQKSLTEKWQEIIYDSVEAGWLFAVDIVCYVFDKLW